MNICTCCGKDTNWDCSCHIELKENWDKLKAKEVKLSKVVAYVKELRNKQSQYILFNENLSFTNPTEDRIAKELADILGDELDD